MINSEQSTANVLHALKVTGALWLLQRAMIPVTVKEQNVKQQAAELQSKPNALHGSFVRTLIEKEEEPEEWPGDIWVDKSVGLSPRVPLNVQRRWKQPLKESSLSLPGGQGKVYPGTVLTVLPCSPQDLPPSFLSSSRPISGLYLSTHSLNGRVLSGWAPGKSSFTA